MQTFLVGGAVRDELLGLPVQERDWVVVGETPESMIAQGFRPVGRDFPVYLHPQSHEEYALARTERKIAPGYRGFAVQTSRDVSLAQDLMRRDLTINAMARDREGRIIDPYQGRRDIELRLLRHVSPAFCEDPVRILRVARFAARYAHLGFEVAPETEALMRAMVEAGEVDALVPERVWTEFERALAEKSPRAYFVVLHRCGAFERLFPELSRLFCCRAIDHAHVENPAVQPWLAVLDTAARITQDPKVRFAAFLSALGACESDSTDAQDESRQRAGLHVLNAFCERLRVPKAYQALAAKVLVCYPLVQNVLQLSAERLVDLLGQLNAFRKESDLGPFLSACEAIGPKAGKGIESPRSAFLLQARAVAGAVDARSLLDRGFAGEALGRELTRLRVARLRQLIDQRSQNPEVKV